jgi:hypothetical protein
MGLGESKVGAEVTSTLIEGLLVNRGNALAVQLQLPGGASRDPAAANNVGVLADGTDATLHVASTGTTGCTHDVGDSNAAGSDVAGSKAGLVVGGVGEATCDVVTITIRTALNCVYRAAGAGVGRAVVSGAGNSASGGSSRSTGRSTGRASNEYAGRRASALVSGVGDGGRHSDGASVANSLGNSNC